MNRRKIKGILARTPLVWAWKGILDLYSDILYFHILPDKYKKAAVQPVRKNSVCFIETRQGELSDNFQMLYEELKRRGGFKIRIILLQELYVSKNEFRRRCCKMAEEIATTEYIFLNDVSKEVSCLPVRKESKVIQVWHACGAFKKFGFSLIAKKAGKSMKKLLRHPGYRDFDCVTVSSEAIRWAYTEAMHQEGVPDAVQALGVSRTDIFFREEKRAQAYEKLYEQYPQARGKKVILYAPTFRGMAHKAYAPDVIDYENMKHALSDQYVLLTKYHPFVKELPKIPEGCVSFARDMTRTMSIEELLFVSDVCISDYSSLIFEYSLFDKPMLFYAFDLEEYFDWRGFYYPYEELTPGPVVRTNDEIIEYIQNIETKFDQDIVVQFKNKFMSACDGNATNRILDYVLNL